MNRFSSVLYRVVMNRWPRRVAPPATKAKMVCVDCGCPIHRHDRHKILQVRHVDCKDPKRVGQMVLPTE